MTVLQYHPWVLAYVFVIGACCGSFLNVVVARLPGGLSLITPRSFCFCCGSRVRWWDNLPCLSYWLLGGACRDCGFLFGIRYWFLELACALAAAFLFYRFGLGWRSFFYFYLFLALLAATAIDLQHRIIPNQITYSGVALGLLLALIGPHIWSDYPLGFTDALIGAVAGGGSLLFVALGYAALTGREGMGLGDVKLLAMLGALLGWKIILPILLWSSLAGSISGLLLIVLLGKGRRYPIPFGPYIALGTLLGLVFDLEKILLYFTPS